jgi:hypothetical protein
MPPLDKDVVNLAKAIRQVESGNRPVTPQEGSGFGGASRYQYSHDTWKEAAKKYLGNENAPLTLENENQATYYRIKEWKDMGKNPAQIVSMWNAGPNEPEAYTGRFSNGKPSVGENQYGVKYDVPSHVQKVRAEYERIKMGGQAAPIGNTQFQTAVPRPEDQGVLGQLGTAPYKAPEPETKLDRRLNQGSEALGKLSTGLAEGDLSQIGSGAIQTGGAVAGGIVDATDALLGLIPGYDAAMDFLGKKVVAPLIEKGGGENVYNQWKLFATEYPEAAKNIGAIGNIVSVIPIFKAARTGMGVVGDTARAGASKTGFISSVEEAAKNELRQSGASAPSKAGQVLSPQTIKGKTVDPVNTIVDGDYLPEVVNDAQGIPRYSATAAINKLDESINLDEQRLQGMLEDASRQGLVGYVPMTALRADAADVIRKAFVDRGQVDAALKKADKIFDDYTKYKGDLVPLTELNNMKRGIREAVNFNSAKLSGDVRYQMGNLFMDKIEEVAEKQGIKAVAEANFDMASKIRAKEALEFLDQRSVVDKAGFRGMLGRRGGDMSTVAGEAVGQSLGMPGIGAAAGRAISNRAISGSGKSVIGKLKSKRTRRRPSKLQIGATLGVLQAQQLQEDPGVTQ